MSELRLLLCIVRQGQSEAYIEFFRERGIAVQFASLCRGTAGKSVLDYLGIENAENVLFQAVIPAASSVKLLHRIAEEMGIELKGNGIAMTIPLSSVGGLSGLQYLTQGQKIDPEQMSKTTGDEVHKMSDILYSLIVAIANKGYTDLVMEAAREGGARGGTTFNARGTAPGHSAKFFGVSIGEEKEIVYILTHKSDREGVMRAIMQKAGIDTAANTVLFSLPVDAMVGLRSLSGDAEE